MKKIKAKDTQKVMRIETKNVEIVENYYTEEEINKTLGKINNAIQLYRYKYNLMPQFIVISRPLEILLHKQTNIMNERQMIMINREPIEIRIIFGVACFVSPELIDLEFKVY